MEEREAMRNKEMEEREAERQVAIADMNCLKLRNAQLYETMQSHKVDFEKTIVEERKDIESRVSTNAKENAHRQKVEYEAEKIEAIKAANDARMADIESLKVRNGQLCGQLEARDNEFRSTLVKLEEMRFALSTVNQASMQATIELENRYAGMCDQLQQRNTEVKSLEEQLKVKNQVAKVKSGGTTHVLEVAETFHARTGLVQSGSMKEGKPTLAVESVLSSDTFEGLPSISEISYRAQNENDGNSSINSSPRYNLKSSNKDSSNNKTSSKTNDGTDINDNVTASKIPLNPFAEESIRNLKNLLSQKDEKLSKLSKEFEIVKRDYHIEKEAHSETSDDYEMRLAVLCDQLEDIKLQLIETKEDPENKKLGRVGDDRGSGRNVADPATNAAIDGVRTRLFDNDLSNITKSSDDTMTEREIELIKEKHFMAETITALEKSNASLTRIGKDLNKKVHSLTPVKQEKEEKNANEDALNLEKKMKEFENEKAKQVATLKELEKEKKNSVEEAKIRTELNFTISTLQNQNSKHIEEIKELNVKIIKLINSAVASTSLDGEGNTSNKSNNSYPLSATFEIERSEKSRMNSGSFVSNADADDDYSIITRSQKTELTMNSMVYNDVMSRDKNKSSTEYVTESVEVLVPRSGADYFASQKKRDTDFLLIPFDRVNEMAPSDVLKLLISYKLEHASISTELDDAKNELNRIKRINIMNATHTPGMKKFESASGEHSLRHHTTSHLSHHMKYSAGKNNHNHIHNHSSNHTTPNSKYTEKNKAENEAKLSSSSISANASRFSSDVFKSTANLLRMKSKSKGGGSVVGSVAESFTTSLWGGSVKDQGEQWENSDNGSVHNNSSHGGSVYDSHKKYVDNM